MLANYYDLRDMNFIGAYLYYFGMVTLAGESPRRTWLLETPNEVVRGRYTERHVVPRLEEG